MKEELRNKVIKGQTKEVLNQLLNLLPEKAVEINTLIATFTEYSRDKMLNLKSYSELEIIRNNIVVSTLNLINEMNDPKQYLKDLHKQERIEELLEILGTDSELENDVLLLTSRYNRNEKDLNSGLIDKRDYDLNLNRIKNTALDYIKQYNGSIPQVSIKTVESTMMIQLKALTQDSKLQRLQPELYNKAVELYRQYKEYDEKKNAPNSIHDSSGRIKDILDSAYKSLKESIENASKDGKESMEELVNRKLSTGIPDWDTIKEVYDVAVGRGYSNQFIDRNLVTRVNDDMAKVEAADLLINWAKNYLR